MGMAIEVVLGKVMGKVVGEVMERLDGGACLPHGEGYSQWLERALDEVRLLRWARPL